MKRSEQTMPVNGAEPIADSKTTQPPVGDGKRCAGHCGRQSDSAERRGDAAPARFGKTIQRQAERNASFWPAEAATVTSRRSVASVASEAEAIIDAFRERVNFYRVVEFQTRADVGPAGEPILRKDGLKKNNPAS